MIPGTVRRLSWAGSTLHWKDISIKRSQGCRPSGMGSSPERESNIPTTSKHIRKLYKRKHDSVTDYLHKVTRYLAEYCREQGITCVIAGDIRNIRREKDLGHRTNQKFHSLPYNRIYIMLEYKLKRYGIRFIKQPANKKSRLN